jgi:hypothetical protein
MMQASSSHIGLPDFEIICSGAVSGDSWYSPDRTAACCSQEYVLRLAERAICWPYLCRLYEVDSSIAGRGSLVSELHLDATGAVHLCKRSEQKGNRLLSVVYCPNNKHDIYLDKASCMSCLNGCQMMRVIRSAKNITSSSCQTAALLYLGV